MINKCIKLFICLLLAILLVVSCSKWNASDVGGIPPIRAALHTNADSAGHRLRISCSGGDYDYKNVLIDHNLTLAQGECKVEFTGTSCDGNCIASTYENDRSAEGIVYFPPISDGQYPLTVQIGNVSLEGTLFVSEFYFSISIAESNSFSFSPGNSIIGRPPPNALLAAIRNVYDSGALSDLINALNAAGQCGNLTLPPNRYNFFDIHSNGEAQIFDQPDDVDTTLVYTYNGDKEALIASFTDWKNTHPEEIYASVRFIDGMQRFFSEY